MTTRDTGQHVLTAQTARRIAGYALVPLAVLLIAVLAVTPLATSLVDRWSRSDVELRSRLVFNSLRIGLAQQLAAGRSEAIVDLFNRIADEEGVLAVGYCNERAELQHRSQQMPPTFSCSPLAAREIESHALYELDGRKLLVGSFPMVTRSGTGRLVILNDLSFADARSAAARNFMILVISAVVLVSAALASLIALFVVRQWTSSMRRALAHMQLGTGESDDAHGPLGEEVRDALRQLDATRAAVDTEDVRWGAESLRAMMANELPGTEVIVVSNRQPYIHSRDADGRIDVKTPASGLVSALEPVMRACGGTWIAHGNGSADRDVVDARDRVAVPPSKPTYTLRRVWISDEEQDGYYYGLANEGLWPLCHIAFVRPTFREADWRTYEAINARFANAVIEEARTKSPIILIQDYHLALLPRMIRQHLPDATIVAFWHIPWPNAETFGICPWKESIIKGLLGSSILGFHTQFHCNNFIDTVDRFIESRIDRERRSVTLGGRETLIRPYPISIEWPPTALQAQKPIDECRAIVRERLGISADTRLAVGIERFDYTKGILDRMWAVDSFLSQNPRWKDHFVFVQAAAPTRTKLQSYQSLQEEAVTLAGQINAKHGRGGYEPIKLIIRHHEPDEVFELFRAADLCIVSSLHDGMNLVAKEFVAARDDEQGVLILSTFAGASRELSEALMVNPYDAHAMGKMIARALAMPETEQRERMRLMREQVRSRNVYRWAGGMLLEASGLRKKQRIRKIAARSSKTVTADAAE